MEPSFITVFKSFFSLSSFPFDTIPNHQRIPQYKKKSAGIRSHRKDNRVTALADLLRPESSESFEFFVVGWNAPVGGIFLLLSTLA
jgi:hypothetical protein